MEVPEKATKALGAKTGGIVLAIQFYVRDYERAENLLTKTEERFGQLP